MSDEKAAAPQAEEQGDRESILEFVALIEGAIDVIDHCVTMFMDQRSTGVPEATKLKAAEASATVIGFLGMMRTALRRQAGETDATAEVEALSSRIILPGEE